MWTSEEQNLEAVKKKKNIWVDQRTWKYKADKRHDGKGSD